MSDALRARARQLVNQLSNLGDGLFRVPANCAVHRRPFVIVSRQLADGVLQPLRTEAPLPGGSGGPAPAPAQLGSFRFDLTSWPSCPHCGTRFGTLRGAGQGDGDAALTFSFWLCGTCGGMNCAGAKHFLYSSSPSTRTCNCGATHDAAALAAWPRRDTYQVRACRAPALPVYDPWIPSSPWAVPVDPAHNPWLDGPKPLRIGWIR